MQMAQRYLNGFKLRKHLSKTNDNHAEVSGSRIDSEIELTCTLVDYTTSIMKEISSLTIEGIVGKPRKKRRNLYGW